MKLESEYERIYQAFLSTKRENDRMRDDNNRLRIQVSAYIDSDAGQKREIGELQAEVAALKRLPACGHTDYHEPHLWGVDETEYECPGIGYDNEGA